MAHFISALLKMLDWNHAQRPPRQRLRSSPDMGSYLQARRSRLEVHFAQQGVVARVGAQGIEIGTEVAIN